MSLTNMSLSDICVRGRNMATESQLLLDPLPNPTDRQRQAYALTGSGRGVLEVETARLESLVATASLGPAGEMP